MVLPTEVLKAWEACDRTDTLFVLVCCVFCKINRSISSQRQLIETGWGIIPAVGIAYSGYTTRSNSLAAVMPAILAVIVCSVQWFLIGYTLTYGEGGAVFGDFKYAFHRNVLAEPVGTIPAILFSFFQLVFQATVCAIAVGGACERGRILPLIPFIFVSLPMGYAKHSLTITALVDVHLQPFSSHGMGRRLSNGPRRCRLCGGHSCPYQFWSDSDCNVRLSLVPPLPIAQVVN